MGDNKRALTLIIEHLEDVEMAVEFVQTVGDQDLWNDLVEQAKTKPRAASHPLVPGEYGLIGRICEGTIGACGEYPGSDYSCTEYSCWHAN